MQTLRIISRPNLLRVYQSPTSLARKLIVHPRPIFPTNAMAAANALFTTTSLKAAGAQPYASMDGKLDPSLLKGLRDMGMEFMTPVQSKVLNMPSLQADWYVDVNIACVSMTSIRTDEMESLA